MRTFVFSSTCGKRIRPVPVRPIVPREYPKSSWYASSSIYEFYLLLVKNVKFFWMFKLTSPKFKRFACFRNSVIAYRSFILRTRLPPRFFLLPSIGLGSGLANFTGGGSCSLSSFFSISSLKRNPISPWTLSWQASTRAANVHLADTKRAALRRRSYRIE